MEQQQAINDILEIVSFIKDNVATKEDIAAVRAEMATKEDIAAVRAEMATKEQLKELEHNMIEHVDGFVALYQKHEVELAAVISRQHRLEDKVDAIVKHLGLNLT